MEICTKDSSLDQTFDASPNPHHSSNEVWGSKEACLGPSLAVVPSLPIEFIVMALLTEIPQSAKKIDPFGKV